VLVAACGSNATPGATSTGGPSHAVSAESHASGLSYARCMRSHGITRFPDPRADGSIDLRASGLNLSAPAVRAAEAACQRLLPTKRPPDQQPTAKAYAQLLRWAKCMRRHGIAGLPDPKPDPVPAPGSASATRFGTVMGNGGYWVGIPYDDDAHSPAFMRLSTSCGISPTGRPHHRG
jgi:hypothetical protein